MSLLRIILIAAGLGLLSCSIIKTAYTITAGTLKLGYTVTNVRVDDRGPFIEGLIIDMSAGASQKLGFYDKGTARVLVEAVQLEGG